METEYIRIYKDKNGEFDFGVSGNMCKIKKEEIQKLRSIIITAVYVAEDMMRREWDKLPENQSKCIN